MQTLAIPAKAEMLTLVCRNTSSDQTVFTLYVDLDRKTVGHTPDHGFSAQISNNEIRWFDTALQNNYILDRISGAYVSLNSSHRAQCQRGSRQF